MSNRCPTKHSCHLTPLSLSLSLPASLPPCLYPFRSHNESNVGTYLMRKRIEENERESEIERDRVGYEKFIVESSKFGHDPSIFSVVSCGVRDLVTYGEDPRGNCMGIQCRRVSNNSKINLEYIPFPLFLSFSMKLLCRIFNREI